MSQQFLWGLWGSIVALTLFYTVIYLMGKFGYTKKKTIEARVQSKIQHLTDKLIDLVEKVKYIKKHYKNEEMQAFVNQFENELYNNHEQFQENVEMYQNLYKYYTSGEITKRQYHTELEEVYSQCDKVAHDLHRLEQNIFQIDHEAERPSKVIGYIQDKLKELEASYTEFENEISLDLFMYENHKNQLHTRFRCITAYLQRDPMKAKVLLVKLVEEIDELLAQLPMVGKYYQYLEEIKSQKLQIKQKIKKNEEVGWDFSSYKFDDRIIEIQECQQYTLNALKRGDMEEISHALSHAKQILDHIEKQMSNHVKMGYEIEKKVAFISDEIEELKSKIEELTINDFDAIRIKFDVDARSLFENYMERLLSSQYELEEVKRLCEIQDFKTGMSIIIEMEQKILDIKIKVSTLTLQSLESESEDIKTYIKILNDQLEMDKEMLKDYRIHQHDNEIRAYQRELNGLLSYMHQQPADIGGIHSTFERVHDQVTHAHKKVMKICHAYQSLTYFLPFVEQKIYEIKKNNVVDFKQDNQEIIDNYREAIQQMQSGDYLRAREILKQIEGVLESIPA